MACPEIEDIIEKFQSFTQKPVEYLQVQNDVKEGITNLVKSLYDFTKSEENYGKNVKKIALPKLIVQDFDEEQIWQEIELQNAECWDQLVWDVANCMSNKKDLTIPIKVAKSKQQPIEKPASENADDNVKQLPDNDEQQEIHKEKRERRKSKKDVMKKTKSSIVDDDFFKLQEMENFLLQEEKKDSKKDGKKADSDTEDESIDLFEDIDDDEPGDGEGTNDMMYSDFFDGEQGDETGDEDYDENNLEQENGNENMYSENENEKEQEQQLSKKGDKRVTFADQSSGDESDDDSDIPQNMANGKPLKGETKSEFELRQQRLKQTISRLEEKSLTEAPWQRKGEVDASKRPQNSLLQEVVDFDLTSRPAPIITEQTTFTLEDIIRRRIKDKAWDDVIRKEKPVEDQLSFRKPEIIDHAKSKLSLAQVYEAEYLKQKQALSGDVEDEKEPESHTQIRESMNKLFAKLDALCHYHYTPKAPQAEVKIVGNTPAISMEEVAPVATSDATLLAPEEVKKKHRGDLMSKDERTQTDRNRERRKKKRLQKKKGKVDKVTDNRNTKKAVEASDKSLKTSKAFFQQLNDDSTSLIKSKNKMKGTKNKGQ